MTVWPLYGLASAATIWFAALSPSEDRTDAKRAAAVLFAGWAIYKAARIIHVSLAFPILDVMIGTGFILMWVECPRPWKLQLFGLIICQMFCHIIYQAALAANWNIGYTYRAALNGLFLCQLWVLFDMGRKRGWSIIVGRVRSIVGRVGAYAFRASHRP